MAKPIVIIGAGSHAREVEDTFEACNVAQPGRYDVLGYIVEAEHGQPGTLVNAKPILGDFNWLAAHAREVWAVGAVGSPQLRQRLIEKAQRFDVRFETVIHPSVILTGEVNLGQGVVVMAGCILTNNIRLGDHVTLNLACTISHDVQIEPFATLSPGVRVCGKVRLGNGCFIGVGANLIPEVEIGEWSVVGAGSTIIRSVPPNSTVVGTPGRLVSHREAGWQRQDRLEIEQ